VKMNSELDIAMVSWHGQVWISISGGIIQQTIL